MPLAVIVDESLNHPIGSIYPFLCSPWTPLTSTCCFFLSFTSMPVHVWCKCSRHHLSTASSYITCFSLWALFQKWNSGLLGFDGSILFFSAQALQFSRQCISPADIMAFLHVLVFSFFAIYCTV